MEFPIEREKPMRAGLVAGSIAAITAASISLPLHSPHDALFNSATVVVGALAAGIVAGILWRVLSNRHNRTLKFALMWGLGFTMVVVLTAAGETQLNRFFSFVLPLATTVFLLTGLLVPLMAPSPKLRPWWPALGAVAIAFAVGISLAGQGDQESGRLELPPRASISPSIPVLETRQPAPGEEEPVSQQSINLIRMEGPPTSWKQR